jgi:hypothetical protein
MTRISECQRMYVCNWGMEATFSERDGTTAER